MDDPISHYPEKEQGELLTIVRDPEFVEPCMFVKGMYLPVFYFLCYEMNIYIDISEDQVLEERDLDLNEQEDIIMDKIRDEHWKGVSEEYEDKKDIHALVCKD